jgi:hypothetical protein
LRIGRANRRHGRERRRINRQTMFHIIASSNS